MEKRKSSEKEAAALFGKTQSKLRSFGMFLVSREYREGYDTFRTGLRIGQFPHLTLAGEKGEEYCVILNSARKDAGLLSEYMRQKGFFYGVACEDGSWELASCVAAEVGKAHKPKTVEKVWNEGEALAFFAREVPAVSMNFGDFEALISPIASEEALQESMREDRGFMSRASYRRRAYAG